MENPVAELSLPATETGFAGLAKPLDDNAVLNPLVRVLGVANMARRRPFLESLECKSRKHVAP